MYMRITKYNYTNDFLLHLKCRPNVKYKNKFQFIAKYNNKVKIRLLDTYLSVTFSKI